MKYTNVLFFALLIVFLASCGAKENKKEPKDIDVEQVIDVDNDTANYPVDLNSADTDLSASQDTLSADTLAVKPVVEEKPAVVEKPKVEPRKHQKRYYIVVGSFRKYGNAKRLNSYFKAKGYKTMVLPRTNELNRVAIVSYVSEKNARKAVKRLRVEHNNYTFWIYRW